MMDPKTQAVPREARDDRAIAERELVVGALVVLGCVVGAILIAGFGAGFAVGWWWFAP